MGIKSIPALAAMLVALGAMGAEGRSDQGADAYLARFEGEWSATGTVRENAQSSARQVSCTLNGTNSGSRAAISGTCRALGIFSREIGVNLQYNPESGLYSGVYTGSPAGPVRLSGRRSGNVLTLDATWPKPINGDRSATMIIRNPAPGRFTFLVVDRLDEGGPVETMTNLSVAAL